MEQSAQAGPRAPRGAERRVHERLGVVVPVEVRVFDRPGGTCIAGPLHALVTDASQSGLRLELAGPAATLFEDPKFASVPVTINFLLVSLVDVGRVACDVRWTQATPEGRAVGLQLSGEARIQGRVLRLLEATSMPRMARRTALKAGAIGATALLVAGLSAFAIDGVNTQDSLRDQVDLLTVQLRDMQRHSDEVESKLGMAVRDNTRLQKELDVLQPEDEADEPTDAQAPAAEDDTQAGAPSDAAAKGAQ